MSFPAKKTPATSWIMSLPHDLLLNCIARVSRLYYPTLSLVSKRFRSLLVSPELYKLRSLLGYTESCLYVCIGSCVKLNPSWFTLCRKPDQTLFNKTGYSLTKVPIPYTCCPDFSNLVAVGSDIYKIGESATYTDTPSSSVSILDCRTHTWREGPRLRVELLSLTAGVIDRKIYVTGCSKDEDSDSLMKNSFHVLDITRQIWDPEPIPCHEAKDTFLCCQSACVDGKFHVKSFMEEFAYNSKEGRWDMVGHVGDRFVQPSVGNYLSTYAYCEIGNVLFCVYNGLIGWYDTEVGEWRLIEGLVGLPKLFPENSFRLADYGGKMAVLWEVSFPSFFSHARSCTIWCAVIELERRQNCEIFGKVQWCDYLLTHPVVCGLVKVLAVTV